MGFTSPLVVKHGIGKLDCPTFGNSSGFLLNPSWSECNDVGSPFIIRSFDAEIHWISILWFTIHENISVWKGPIVFTTCFSKCDKFFKHVMHCYAILNAETWQVWMIIAMDAHSHGPGCPGCGSTNPPGNCPLGTDSWPPRLSPKCLASSIPLGDQGRLWPKRCEIKTRWSPRTRMLTRMLMAQMSKHMALQWRTIPFCNSLFEQSCTCFPCYQSAVWSGKCRAWSVECEVRSVECKVWSGECRVCKV